MHCNWSVQQPWQVFPWQVPPHPSGPPSHASLQFGVQHVPASVQTEDSGQGPAPVALQATQAPAVGSQMGRVFGHAAKPEPTTQAPELQSELVSVSGLDAVSQVYPQMVVSGG